MVIDSKDKLKIKKNPTQITKDYHSNSGLCTSLVKISKNTPYHIIMQCKYQYNEILHIISHKTVFKFAATINLKFLLSIFF